MILIVEDDPLARRALQSLFAARGHACRAVPSAEDALNVVEGMATLPELVLVDIDLPGMNGLELVKLLQLSHPGLACAMMSANEYESAPRAQAVPFVAKPLSLSKLLSVLSRMNSGQVA